MQRCSRIKEENIDVQLVCTLLPLRDFSIQAVLYNRRQTKVLDISEKHCYSCSQLSIITGSAVKP